MRKYQPLEFFCLCVLLCALCACRSRQVAYEDPRDVLLAEGWSTTDLQNTAEAMTQSLLASKWISGVQSPPIVRLREVQSRTTEQIDTRAITEKIRVQLIKSGQVLFVSSDRELEQIMKEMQLDQDQTLRGKNKPLLHTNYIVTGAVRSDTKTTDRGDVITDYNVTLELVHPESGMVYWSDEKEIRKRTPKAAAGRNKSKNNMGAAQPVTTIAMPGRGVAAAVVRDGFTLQDMRAAIFNGCAGKGWSAADMDANTVEARTMRGKRVVAVSIPYTATSYFINYKDSSNMSYKIKRDGTISIHRSYYTWVNELHQAINVNIAK